MLGDYAVKCKTAASSQFDPDKHEPEIEKQLFLEMAKWTKIEVECYEAFAASYK